MAGFRFYRNRFLLLKIFLITTWMYLVLLIYKKSVSIDQETNINVHQFELQTKFSTEKNILKIDVIQNEGIDFGKPV